MSTVYKWWAGLMLVAVVVQIGLAGYGAFYTADKVDGGVVDEDTFEDGFGPHMIFGSIILLLGLIFVIIGLAGGIGKWRLGRQGVLFLLLILQMLLAGFGSEVPAIGFFHPVNALLILLLILWIVNDTWRGGRMPASTASPPPAAV